MSQSWIRGAWQGAWSIMAPWACVSCRASLSPGRGGEGGWRDALCLTCLEAAGWIEAACLACGRSIGPGADEAKRCPRCRDQPKGEVASTTALLMYRGPVRALLARLKYGSRDRLGASLGEDLGRRWLSRRSEGPHRDLIVVPVPLHLWRRCRRGFNQAEEIARGVAAVLGRPMVLAISRRRATPALFEVEHEAREAAVAGAFRARRASLVGRRVVLVDDIRTSGATLREAAAALRDAGAVRVEALVVGR